MAEDILTTKCVLVLQSCVISPGVFAGCSTERSVTQSNTYGAISIKVEKDTDICIKEEDLSEAVVFPTIKVEQDEVR
jgi:hypothetical protein